VESLQAGRQPVFSWTVIATTGERFSDFAPYVAAVNDAGMVAFQAALRDGGSGVFAGSGEAAAQLVGADVIAVTSHPDVNLAGETSFYGDLPGGGQGVFVLRDGRLQTIADTRGRLSSVGPLGPTMNEAGMVAFRADPAEGVSGIFVGDAADVATVAETGSGWSRFHGLPVIDSGGAVVFRADGEDGVEGIYSAREGAIRAVAETGDVFESLALFPSVNDRGTVAFAATLRDQGSAILIADDGRITVVDSDGEFERFRGALIDDAGSVVRIATARGGSLGLFSGPDPKTDRILAIGDQLFGSTVTDFASNPVSINAVGHLAVRARLADGRQLILRTNPGG
jgi:hypothetical protein